MTQPEVKIRQSADDDMVRITEIYGRSVTEDRACFDFEPPGVPEMMRRRSVLLDAGYPYLVAEVDGRVEGYAYAGAFHSRPGYRSTVENTVYVSPDLQRGGVGRALMKRLIEECTARGYRQMMAVIGGTDRVASISFHKALGFSDAGHFKSVGYKHGKWLDTVQLQLALGPGDTTPPDKVPG